MKMTVNRDEIIEALEHWLSSRKMQGSVLVTGLEHCPAIIRKDGLPEIMLKFEITAYTKETHSMPSNTMKG